MKHLLRILGLLALSSCALAGNYVGDYALGDTIYCKFGTVRPSTGASFTLAGTPVVSAYPDASTTQLTAGITLTVDFDGVTGMNHLTVVASGGNGYATGTFYSLQITTGTVDSISVTGQEVCSFSLGKVSALRPATPGRTVVVDAAGLADANAVKLGPTGAGTAQTARDLGTSVLLSSGTGTGQLSIASGIASVNVSQVAGTAVTTLTGAYPLFGIIDSGTAQAVTGTTLQLRSAANFDNDAEIVGSTCVINTATTGAGQSRTVTAYTNSTDTATVPTWTTTPTGTITYVCFGTSSSSGSVSVAAGGITSGSFAAGAIDASAIATDAIGAAEIATDAIGAAEIAANAIGSSEFTQAFPTNFSALAITGGGAVTAGTVSDKTGYALSATGLNSVLCTEPSAVPTWSSTSVLGFVCWQAAFSVNKVTQTSTTKTLRNSADNANLETCAVSDNGTTFTLSKCSP
jgi:hypothetical protein